MSSVSCSQNLLVLVLIITQFCVLTYLSRFEKRRTYTYFNYPFLLVITYLLNYFFSCNYTTLSIEEVPHIPYRPLIPYTVVAELLIIYTNFITAANEIGFSQCVKRIFFLVVEPKIIIDRTNNCEAFCAKSR